MRAKFIYENGKTFNQLKYFVDSIDTKWMIEYNEEELNEGLLVEGFNLKEFINKFPILSTIKRINILASILLLNAGITINTENKEKIINDNPRIIQLAKQPEITYNDLISFLNMEWGLTKEEVFQNYRNFSTSDSAKEFIKNHEKLRLTGYKLGDGKITIGWGHAEPIHKSKYKEGQTITIEEAKRLFDYDINEKEKGIKSLFKMWEEQGIDVEITQGMFDAMVSMAFNMGVNGLRSSDFVLLLKDKKYYEAADSILTTRIKNAASFPGILTRREKERDLFLQDITEI